mmetsp:Transcript_22077/g.44867  ORF Transcript_22077/g.44867 Transcript_22077/m.44867 type:complete len:346 (-) Transcript_22077:33-1070(-)
MLFFITTSLSLLAAGAALQVSLIHSVVVHNSPLRLPSTPDGKTIRGRKHRKRINFCNRGAIGVVAMQKRVGSISLHSSQDDIENDSTRSEAERLFARAKAIRDSLPPPPPDRSTLTPTTALRKVTKQSTFSLTDELLSNGYNYRLYVDIGREQGTWMDPRWGSSGRRIEMTVDISLRAPIEGTQGNDASSSLDILASNDISNRLTKTATRTSSFSPINQIQSAPYARLKGGFDKMAISNGGYCIESPSRSVSSSTLRFCLHVCGTQSSSGSYGDVYIPAGYLFFALPYFGMRNIDGKKQMSLSTKEGTVTVKQMGWNTGWWREESRILGVFRAVPLDLAQQRDKF